MDEIKIYNFNANEYIPDDTDSSSEVTDILNDEISEQPQTHGAEEAVGNTLNEDEGTVLDHEAGE